MKNAPRSKKAVIGKPFEAGNPGGPGRPPGPSLSHQLREAVQRVEARRRKPLLEHFVERAYTSDRVLIALLKKLIPDLGQQAVNLSGDVSRPLTLEELIAGSSLERRLATNGQGRESIKGSPLTPDQV